MRNFLPALAAAALLAHGDAAWIAAGGYVGRDGTPCCGEHDCGRAPAGAVVRVAGEWWLPDSDEVFVDGQKGLHRSVDEDFWWCRPLDQKPIFTRCLFIPPEPST